MIVPTTIKPIPTPTKYPFSARKSAYSCSANPVNKNTRAISRLGVIRRFIFFHCIARSSPDLCKTCAVSYSNSVALKREGQTLENCENSLEKEEYQTGPCENREGRSPEHKNRDQKSDESYGGIYFAVIPRIRISVEIFGYHFTHLTCPRFSTEQN